MRSLDSAQPNLVHDGNKAPPAVMQDAPTEPFPLRDAPVSMTATHAGVQPIVDGTVTGYPTLRHAALSHETRSEHDALLVAMHRLEAALAAAAPGREQAWNARVQTDLRPVQEALVQHISSAEAPDGLLAEIDVTKPTMVRRVERLRREHAELLRQATDLQQRVEQLRHVEEKAHAASERAGTTDTREQAAQLLDALRRHQAQEADLIFETFYTDIGAGD